LAAGRRPAEALVLELRRQGLTFEEIGARVGLNEKTARRLIDSLRERMEARQWE
jgi:RNA polymerase sigma-70 factor (ECF subfamily)